MADELAARVALDIKRLRKRIGVTQEQLAERVGMNARKLQRIEAGRVDVRVSTLGRLAAALEVDVAELLAEPPA